MRHAARVGGQFAGNFIQGAGTETISQAVLGRDAPMTGRPTVGGGLGSIVVKALFSAFGKNPPAQLSSTSVGVAASSPSVSASPSSPTPSAQGEGPSWLVVGLVVAGVAVVSYGAYRYLKKAQDVQAAGGGGDDDDDGMGEVIGALISDPTKMGAFKSQLRKELAKSNYPKDEIGKEVARIIAQVRKAAEMPDSIPADVSGLFK